MMELWERFIGSRRVGEEKIETFMRGINRRRLLRTNPTMTSKRFQDTLDELKKAAAQYRKGFSGKNASGESQKDGRDED